MAFSFAHEAFLLMDSTIDACFMHCLNKAPQQSNTVITQQFIQRAKAMFILPVF